MPAFTNDTLATPSLIDTLTHAHARMLCTQMPKIQHPFFELFFIQESACRESKWCGVKQSLVIHQPASWLQRRNKGHSSFFTLLWVSLWTYPILKDQKVREITVGCGTNEIDKNTECLELHW